MTSLIITARRSTRKMEREVHRRTKRIAKYGVKEIKKQSRVRTGFMRRSTYWRKISKFIYKLSQRATYHHLVAAKTEPWGSPITAIHKAYPKIKKFGQKLMSRKMRL